MFENTNFLVLWVTNDCNLRCKYCYANAGDKKEYMPFDTAKKAIDMPKGNFKLQLAGGEPLLNFKLIKEIYKYLKVNRQEIKLQMQTNGVLINSEIAKEIKEMNIAVGISLDGPFEINERLRGSSASAINGIGYLGQEDVMVNLNAVITEENIEYLDKLVDLAFYFGNVGGIGLDLLRKAGRTCKGDVKTASPDKIRNNLIKAYKRTVELSMLSGRKIIIREIEEARKRLLAGRVCENYCHAVYGGSIVVLPDGRLYPCGSLVNNDTFYMGNINDLESYKIVKLENKRAEVCSTCKYKEVCQGACPSRSILNSDGSGFTIEDCILRKTAFQIVENEMSNKGSVNFANY